MPRFEAYVDFMTGGKELLPLGAFSPMGRQQPVYLDALIQMDAEEIAQRTALEVTKQLQVVPDKYKLALVVVDAPPGKNTWTHRHVTDAEWRLERKYDSVPMSDDCYDRWVTVQLWTDEPACPEYIQQETRSALFRAAHQSQQGKRPDTLQEYLQQEGRAMAFADCAVELEADDIEYSKQVLEPLLQSTHYPTCFAALYGDEIAKQVGYPPLGLSHHAGFQVGLSDALLLKADELLPNSSSSKTALN